MTNPEIVAKRVQSVMIKEVIGMGSPSCWADALDISVMLTIITRYVAEMNCDVLNKLRCSVEELEVLDTTTGETETVDDPSSGV